MWCLHDWHRDCILLFKILISLSAINYMLTENYFGNSMDIFNKIPAYKKLFSEEVLDESFSAEIIQTNNTDNNSTKIKSNKQQKPAKKKRKGKL